MAAQKNPYRLTRGEFEALAAAIALAEVSYEDDLALVARITAAWAKVKSGFYGS